MCSGMVAIAQPNYIYEGGNGGGYVSLIQFSTEDFTYSGGAGQGYTNSVVQTMQDYLYRGNIGDGYTVQKEENFDRFIYTGSDDDGYTKVMAASNSPTPIYNGGTNDGYVLAERCEDFIWTGAVGSGWLVSGNWNYNIIPDIKRRVIIPADVTTFPALNAGVFAIGENPNNGGFECAAIWIQENAQLITRINNFIENYGEIRIDGTMRVRNSAVNALQNIESGIIQINPTGSLIVKP